MQMARGVQERTQHFPDCDMVLERLIIEGTFDWTDPNTPDVREELAMNHASLMVQWLLMQIENLESQVSWSDDHVCLVRLTSFVISYTTPVFPLTNSVPM